MTEQKKTLPTQSLLNGKVYTPSYKTDIRETFSKLQPRLLSAEERAEMWRAANK